jgi:2'-5' RNA ligase
MHDMYLCIVKDNDEVSSYVRRLRRACAEQEIPFDRKSFLPHITLLRKADVNNEPDLSELIQEQTMPVSAISLMKSERGKNGMVYTEIGRIEYIPEHHE